MSGSWSRPTRAIGTHLALPLHATILTNVEADFLDFYGSLDELIDGFDRYLEPDRRPEGLVSRRSGLCVARAAAQGDDVWHVARAPTLSRATFASATVL